MTEPDAWSFSDHALRRIRAYRWDVREILHVVHHWENEYGSSTRYPDGYRVRQGGRFAVVIDPDNETIVTVLQRRPDLWGRKAVTA